MAIDLTLPSGLPDDGRGAVVTVGTFDGVHLGHRAILEEVRARAVAMDRRAVLLTFYPHPLRIVRPEAAPPLLTTPVEKKEILAQTGLDYAVFLRFTPALSRYPPRRFIEEILVGRLGVRELVVGHDHGFGRGRSGDANMLREIGKELGFAVDVVAPVTTGADAVSSSGIRDALSRGRLGLARKGLGRPYSLRGLVIRGDGRGRDLGFPTANLSLGVADKLLPRSGIYAVRGTLRRGMFHGALHLGPRPTFQESLPTIELHLLDFTGQIYGEEVRVDFIRFLRPIRVFRSAAALVRQIELDVTETRAALCGDSTSSDGVVR